MPAISPVSPKARAVRGTRVDPPRRSTRVALGMWVLQNQDPNRHYVWAYKSSEQTGLEYYLQLGYVIEKASKDGVRVSGEIPYGSPIEKAGHVLVSIEKEEREAIEYYGADGEGGLARSIEIMKRIVRQNRSDLLEGITIGNRPASMVMPVVNTTSELHIEE